MLPCHRLAKKVDVPFGILSICGLGVVAYVGEVS
jgi:hypothetical protein